MADEPKRKQVRDPETYFAALLLRFGPAPNRAFVNRVPESRWGVSIRSLARTEAARNYEGPILRLLRQEFSSPGRVFCEFIRWQGEKGLTDISKRKLKGELYDKEGGPVG